MKFKLLPIFSIVGLLLLSGTAKAQLFQEESSYLSVGYGIGNFTQALIFEDYVDRENYDNTATGPFFLKYEAAIAEKIGFGVNVAYIGSEVTWTDPDHTVDNGNGPVAYRETIKWSSYSILARINWHFGTSDKFDPYFGFGMGYRDAKWEFEDNDPNYDDDTDLKNPFKFGFETTLGVRLKLVDNVLLYSEFGMAKAIVQFGLTVKL